MAAAGRRGIDVKSRSQRSFQGGLAIIDRDTLLGAHIDAIKAAATAQYLLGRVDVHYGQIAAKCAPHSGRTHESPYGEFSISFNRRELNLTVHSELVALGKLCGYH